MKAYITFSKSHIHKINGKVFDKDCVAVIECDESRIKDKIFEYFDQRYSRVYSEEERDLIMISFYPRGFIKIN